MRSLVLFVTVSVLHFVLSIVGFAFALSAAFAMQTGFWTAPGQITLAYVGGILLAPLSWLGIHDFELAGIGALSLAFGAAAVGLLHLWRAHRARAATRPD